MPSNRARLRERNYYGTLGFQQNFDGTEKIQPVNVEKPVRAQDPPSIYYGFSNEVQKQPRHGPGIETTFFSDAMENLERKKKLQAELASFEKIQRLERENRKIHELLQKNEPSATVWPFSNRNHHSTSNQGTLKEIHDTKMQYARDLDFQIAKKAQIKKMEEEKNKKSLPSYFRFGRPGAGAPIMDASGKHPDPK
ncbi:hypothetical protein HDU97_003778 [Phlyctochytrium planicorne]|nr:hypothetical protein HDU97_003778 [Phlyctochytrium planicorne]